ncbi:MAG: sodium-dependent transporter [Bacillota bacterium]|nr:sodium-dependent transporter [Bacillota bacterium]
MSGQTLERESWGGRFGAIMAMSGMCVGLGAVWRFPYLVGEYGGGAFLFAFLVCMAVCVVPLALVEAALGKGIGKGVMDTYGIILKNTKAGNVIGGIITTIYSSMNFFFIPVMATTLYFLYVSVTSMWEDMPASSIYDYSASQEPVMLILVVGLTLYVGFVLYKGIGSGIERVSKVMVPAIIVIFAALIIFCLFSIPGIVKGYNFYLNPDFSQLANVRLWVAAMGQACFSVGIGPGCVLVYGSHLKKSEDVTISITTVCLMDIAISVLAGLAIIPACVGMDLDPESGAKLIFVIIPAVLEQLPFGNVIGVLVFLGVFFAGITTAFAQMEVAVTSFSDALKASRKKITVLWTAITLAGSIPCVFNDALTQFWSDLAGNYGFIITAGMGAVAFCYMYGVRKIRESYMNSSSRIQLGTWFDIVVKFVAAPIMLFIVLNSIFPVL